MSLLSFVVVAAGSKRDIGELINCFILGSLGEGKLVTGIFKRDLRYLRLNVGVPVQALAWKMAPSNVVALIHCRRRKFLGYSHTPMTWTV